MKFYGTPNMGVYERKNRKDIGKVKRPKLLFRFDSNGEFITEDEKLIAKLVKRFKHDETITTIEEKPVEAEEVEIRTENTLRHCKKCDFVCATQGELLRHYRENHPKGGD